MPDVKVEPKRVVFAFVFAAYLLIQIERACFVFHPLGVSLLVSFDALKPT